MNRNKLAEYLKKFPFIAITRGIKPSEAVDCAEALASAGFLIIETPLNSPEPFTTIKLMAEHLGGKVLIGAGTVTQVDQVEEVQAAGGKIIVSPNCNPEIIKKTKKCGLISIPGVATPTEAFAALQAGADALKLFPAEAIPPAAVTAMGAVLPPDTLLIPVGSIAYNNWQPYFQAGARGFGLGSSLYAKGISKEELKVRANNFKISRQQIEKTRDKL